MMNNFIHVTLREDESLTADPGHDDFVVEVSRDSIMDDLKDEHSLVRQKFQAVADVDKFIDEHLPDIQATLAGEVALTYARRNNPNRLNRRLVEPTLWVGKRPSRDYDGAVGQFGVWVM
jgi:hypothetical protein